MDVIVERRPDPSIVRAMIQRRKVTLGALGATAAVATAGGSAPSRASASPTVAPGPVAGSPPPPPVRMSVTPAAGAKGVSPGQPVVVTVEGGTLRSATVTAGKETISGAVQPDGTWRSTEDLAYGKTYKV